MNESMAMPCAEWVEKLAAAHPDDLTPSEREELEAHVASCPACATVRAQYRAVETLIRDLPAGDAPADIPPKLLHLWEEDARRPEMKKRAVASPVVSTPELTRPIARHARLARAMKMMAAVLIVGVLLGVGVWRLLALIPPHSGKVTTEGGPGGLIGIGISAIPVFSQSTIYVSNGELKAFRSDNGSLIRSYKVGDALVGTPAIVNGIIYISGKEAVYALRVSDGSILWHYPAKISTFLPPVVVGGIVYITPYVTANDHYLYALRASDGTLLWRYKANSDENISPPLVANGVAYTGSADMQNAYINALSTSNGTLLWRHRVGERFVAPALANGVIYAGSYNSISALRASDGSLLWHRTVDSPVGQLTVDGGVLYALADNGFIYALRASNGTLLWSQRIGGNATLSVVDPIVVDGVIYVGISTGGIDIACTGSRKGSYIYALRASDGHVLWRDKLGCNVIPSLVVGNGAVYAVSGNTLYALRGGDGAVLWHRDILS